MAPAVAECAQMRFSGSSVFPEVRRNFRDVHAQECSPHDHLAREFHARRLQIQTIERGFSDAAQPAVHVADWKTKEEAAERRKERIPDDTMAPMHCATLNSSAETISHHKIISFFEAFEELRNLPKIVT